MGNGKDLFFHAKSLQGVEYAELSEGMKVSFTESQKASSGPCAEDVKVI